MMDSLKKTIIRTLAMAPQIDMLTNNQVILTTAAGVIAGKIVEENSEKQGDMIYSKVLDAITEKYEADIEGNDGYMLLSDVTVINGNARTNLKNLIVFYDQIIGVTLGTI